MIAVMFALVLAGADTGGAQPPPPPHGEAQAAAPRRTDVDPNKVVCREEDRAGMRVINRVCRTIAEWDAHDQEVWRFFREVEARSGQSVAVSGTTPQ